MTRARVRRILFGALRVVLMAIAVAGMTLFAFALLSIACGGVPCSLE